MKGKITSFTISEVEVKFLLNIIMNAMNDTTIDKELDLVSINVFLGNKMGAELTGAEQEISDDMQKAIQKIELVPNPNLKVHDES